MTSSDSSGYTTVFSGGDDEEGLEVPSSLARSPSFSRDFHTIDLYDPDDFPIKVGSWAKQAESDITNAALAAVKPRGKKDIVPIVKAGAKKEYHSLKQDCKDLFRLHVGSVVNTAKDSMQHGTRLANVGKALSFAGELWDGMSGFWNDLTHKHPVLKPLDTLVIKPSAIALYATLLPEIAVVKACEFVGRSITGLAKTGKVWNSILDSAKKTGASIVKHALRLANGASADPAISAFYRAIGLGDGKQKDLLDLITRPDQMQMLRKLSPGIATSAAENINKMLQDNAGVDLATVVTPVLRALNAKTITLDMESFMEHLRQDPNNARLTNIAALLSTSHSVSNPSILQITGAIKSLPGITKDLKSELIKFATDYAVSTAVESVKGQLVAAQQALLEEDRAEAPKKTTAKTKEKKAPSKEPKASHAPEAREPKKSFVTRFASKLRPQKRVTHVERLAATPGVSAKSRTPHSQ